MAGPTDPSSLASLERRAQRLAQFGVLAITAGFVANLFLLDALARRFHEQADNPDAATQGFQALVAPLALAAGAIACYLPVVAGFAAVVYWSYRATRSGEVLGLMPRRPIVLGMASWFIPIVNFWWPYEVIIDTTPRGFIGRRWVLGWWLTWQVALYVAPLHFVNALFGWSNLDRPLLIGSLVVLLVSCGLGLAALAIVSRWHRDRLRVMAPVQLPNA